MTGHTVIVKGSYVLIRFYSDDMYQEQRFLLDFTPVQIGKCEALSLHREKKRSTTTSNTGVRYQAKTDLLPVLRSLRPRYEVLI